MKNHAFLIEAHAYPEITAAVINRLSAENHYFFIHIDKKTKDISQYVALENDRVFLTHRRHRVRWGSFEQILLTITLLRQALSLGVSFDYFHLISGQDYPVLDAVNFDYYFESDNKSYMELIPDGDFSRRYMYYRLNSLLNVHGKIGRNLDHYFLSFQKWMSGFLDLRKPLGLIAYKGANWWSLDRTVIGYVMDYLDQRPDYILRFKHTYCCDEIFFHTLIFNSPVRNRVILNNLRYVDWKKKESDDILPRILDENDYESIIHSRCLFVRKVTIEKSSKLMKLLDTYC